MSVIPTTIYKTVTLRPGEQFVLPPSGSVVAITGGLTSTCDNLPAPESLNCYYMQWEIADVSNNDSDAWEGGEIDKITVAGIDYPVHADAFISNNGGYAKLENVLNSIGGVTSVVTHSETLGNDRINSVCFKSIPSIASNLVMHLHSNGRPGYANSVTLAQLTPRPFDGTASCACG